MKTKSAKRFSDIVKGTKLKTAISIEDREFIESILVRTKRYKSITEKSKEVSYIPRMIKIASGRHVRMLCAEYKSPEGKSQQICISKTKAIEEAFPKKTREGSSSSLDKTKKISNVRASMRLSIQSQISKFRKSVSWPTVCVETGAILYQHDKTHVDHAGTSPFVKLVEDWLEANDLYYSSIDLVGPPTAKRFKDESLTKSWQKFHKENAQLEMISASYNMAKGANNWEITKRWNFVLS